MISPNDLKGQLGKLKKASWREPRFLQKEDSKESIRKAIASIDLKPKSYIDLSAEELEKYEKSDLEKLKKNLVDEKKRILSINSTIANSRNFFERIYKIAAENAYDKNIIIKKMNDIKRVDKNLNTASYCDTIIKVIEAREVAEDIRSYFQGTIDKSNKGIAKGREDIALIDEKLKLVEQRIKYLIDLEDQAKQVVISAAEEKLPEFIGQKPVPAHEIKKAVVFVASVAASFMVLGTASAAALSLTLAATACAKHVTNRNHHEHINRITDLTNKYLLFGVTGFSVGVVENVINYTANSIIGKTQNDQANSMVPYITNTVLASGCCMAHGIAHGIVTFSFIKGVELMQEQVNYWSDFNQGMHLSTTTS
jgi:hypothetical protein